MKLTVLFNLLIALVFILGCACKEPTGIPPASPEPLEGDALGEEMEVIVIESGEAGEEPEAEIVTELEVEAPVPERQNLSWEEIENLGFQHEVLPGETLSGIAGRYNIGTGLLVRLNGIQDPDLIRNGRKLAVIEGPFRIEVDKSERSLSIYLGEEYIRSYPVAVGKKNSTPEGEFEVVRKLVKPPWTDPYHRTIIPADNPEYPLGTRWIEFKAPPGAYGIHGSKIEEEIGTEASFGCVRVLHPQEEEIYDFVILGSPVVITP